MYFAHHNGERYRSQAALPLLPINSAMAFVEVKMKTNKERMVKFRRPVAQHLQNLDNFDRSLAATDFPYQFEDVRAVVWNRFRRFTLAHFENQERLTVDLDIEFGDGAAAVRSPRPCSNRGQDETKFSMIWFPLPARTAQAARPARVPSASFALLQPISIRALSQIISSRCCYISAAIFHYEARFDPAVTLRFGPVLPSRWSPSCSWWFIGISHAASGFIFTYMVFSVMAYLVTSLLHDILTLGFSFGLLAVSRCCAIHRHDPYPQR